MTLFTNATPVNTQPDGFMITASRVRLPIDELKFLQATGNYSWLYWTNGEKVLTSRTLNYYQPQLPGAWFIRLHRNCIVNLRYVERLERVETNKSGLVYLHSGEVLPVSRRRLCMVKRLIVRYQNSTTN